MGHARNLLTFHCPRFGELPNIPLYLDQMLMVIQGAIGAFFAEDEPAVTKMMINNYVKQKLIQAPVQKKYGREQIAKIIVISLLKRCFSIGEIDVLIENSVREHGIEKTYDLFASHLDTRLAQALDPDASPYHIDLHNQSPEAMIDTAITALLCKYSVQQNLARKQSGS